MGRTASWTGVHSRVALSQQQPGPGFIGPSRLMEEREREREREGRVGGRERERERERDEGWGGRESERERERESLWDCVHGGWLACLPLRTCVSLSLRV